MLYFINHNHMKSIISTSLFAILVFILFSTCEVYNAIQTTQVATKTIKSFSSDEDIKLGKMISQEIERDKSQFPILSKTTHAQAYDYINQLVDTILASDEIKYRDKFAWEIKIIDRNVLNAFALPGGYIYVYTGLIKFLDSENELIGVLAHEIAHSDRRHSVRQFRKNVGASYLLQATLGNTAYIQSLSQQLLDLKFNRSYEAEADEFSVKYLCPTVYDASGAAGFFEKLETQGGERSAQFLSTHPLPENRVEAIHQHAVKNNCQGDSNFKDNYAAKKQYFN